MIGILLFILLYDRNSSDGKSHVFSYYFPVNDKLQVFHMPSDTVGALIDCSCSLPSSEATDQFVHTRSVCGTCMPSSGVVAILLREMAKAGV